MPCVPAGSPVSFATTRTLSFSVCVKVTVPAMCCQFGWVVAAPAGMILATAIFVPVADDCIVAPDVCVVDLFLSLFHGMFLQPASDTITNPATSKRFIRFMDSPSPDEMFGRFIYCDVQKMQLGKGLM